MSDAPPPTPGPPPQPRTVARLIPGAVSPARLAALRTGAVLARAEAAVVTLTGPGADRPGSRPGRTGRHERGRARDRRCTLRLAAHHTDGGDRGLERSPRGRGSRAGRRGHARTCPHSRGVATARRRGGRQDDSPGSPLRRAGRRVVYQGVLHRPGDRLAPALSRSYQPLPAGPAVRR